MKGRARLLVALLLAIGSALVLSFRGGVDAQTLEQWIDAADGEGLIRKGLIALALLAALAFLPRLVARLGKTHSNAPDKPTTEARP